MQRAAWQEAHDAHFEGDGLLAARCCIPIERNIFAHSRLVSEVDATPLRPWTTSAQWMRSLGPDERRLLLRRRDILAPWRTKFMRAAATSPREASVEMIANVRVAHSVRNNQESVEGTKLRVPR